MLKRQNCPYLYTALQKSKSPLTLPQFASLVRKIRTRSPFKSLPFPCHQNLGQGSKPYLKCRPPVPRKRGKRARRLSPASSSTSAAPTGRPWAARAVPLTVSSCLRRGLSLWLGSTFDSSHRDAVRILSSLIFLSCLIATCRFRFSNLVSFCEISVVFVGEMKQW